MIAAITALLSGALFYLSQGPADLWVLAWLAPAPVLWLAYGAASNRQLFLASFAAFVVGQSYVFLYQGVFASVPLVIAVPILISAFVLQAALFPLSIAFARAVWRRAQPAAALFAFPACWTAVEYMIGLFSPHGSFGSLAYSQMSAPVAIQSASLLGMYSVTFLVCLFANALAIAVRGGKGTAVAAGLGTAICALNLVFGLLRLAEPEPETIRVAALSNVKAMVKAYRADTLVSAVDLSMAYGTAIRAATAEGARLVVLPEGGVIVKRPWRNAVFAPLMAASKDSGAEIVTGVLERAPQGDLALTFSPDGSTQSYAKRHLMPILEAQFVPGNAAGRIGHARAVAICKDMDFPRSIRADAQGGVRLMAVPAEDFVYDAWIHGRVALMRGVENGFSVLRAAYQGLLTASDAQGRLVASKTALASAGMSVLIADLPLGPGVTLYTRIGDAFAWFCLALSLGLAAFAFVRGRRQGSSAGQNTAKPLPFQ